MNFYFVNCRLLFIHVWYKRSGLHTVNQEIFTNDLFGEFGRPVKNAKFNPAKIYICLKDNSPI